ncbi:MAG: hypothetical protein AAFX06_32230 [Planctomycetota bacterium]
MPNPKSEPFLLFYALIACSILIGPTVAQCGALDDVTSVSPAVETQCECVVCHCDEVTNKPASDPPFGSGSTFTGPDTLDESTSFRGAMEALFAGDFDDQLTRRQKRQKRILGRQYRRSRDKETFFDNLFTGIEQDAKSLALMPGVFGSDEFDQNTPLGLTAGGLFDLIDGLLERVPAIIEAIRLFIDLFSWSNRPPPHSFA